MDLLFAVCLEKQAEQLACASLMEEAQLLQQALQQSPSGVGKNEKNHLQNAVRHWERRLQQGK